MKAVQWSLAAVLFIAFCAVSVSELRALPAGDEILYLGMGRGVLNGLHLWKDLFETKPPVVFWVGAFSFLLTNGDALYRVIILFGLLSMTALLAYFRGILGMLIGYSLSLYVLIRGAGYQTESFSVLPVTLAILVFPEKGYRAEVLCGLCLAFVALLKEPFVLTLEAAFLLFISRYKDLLKLVRIGGIAIAVSLLVLTVTGNVGNYFSIYLPEMLHGRVLPTLLFNDYTSQTRYWIESPVWLRGFFVRRLLSKFFLEKSTWLFGLTLAVFAVCSLPRKQRLAGVAAIAICLVMMDRIVAMNQVVTLLGFFPTENRFFQWQIVLLAALSVSLTALSAYLFIKSRQQLLAALQVVACVYLSVTAAGIGSFFAQHTLFSLPLWFAWFMKAKLSKKGEWAVVAILCVGLIPLQVDAGQKLQDDASVSPKDIAAAKALDSVMTACGIDRYMVLDDLAENTTAFNFTSKLPALTDHSPYQLGYGAFRAADHDGKAANPYFKDKFEKDWAIAKIAVSNTPADKQPIPLHFTSSVPHCASGVALRGTGLNLFYRI